MRRPTRRTAVALVLAVSGLVLAPARALAADAMPPWEWRWRCFLPSLWLGEPGHLLAGSV